MKLWKTFFFFFFFEKHTANFIRELASSFSVFKKRYIQNTTKKMSKCRICSHSRTTETNKIVASYCSNYSFFFFIIIMYSYQLIIMGAIQLKLKIKATFYCTLDYNIAINIWNIRWRFVLSLSLIFSFFFDSLFVSSLMQQHECLNVKYSFDNSLSFSLSLLFLTNEYKRLILMTLSRRKSISHPFVVCLFRLALIQIGNKSSYGFLFPFPFLLLLLQSRSAFCIFFSLSFSVVFMCLFALLHYLKQVGVDSLFEFNWFLLNSVDVAILATTTTTTAWWHKQLQDYFFFSLMLDLIY